MQYPGNAVAMQPYRPLTCLKSSIMTIGIIGLILWITCFGLSAGFCFEPYALETTRFVGFLLVVVHAAYIFLTSEILYFVSNGDPFSHDELRKLRRTTSRLLATTLTGVGVSVAIIIHVCMYGFIEGEEFFDYHYVYYNAESISTAFGCSFSFIWTFIFFTLTAVYYKKCLTQTKFGGLPGHPPGNGYPMTTMTGTTQQMAMTGPPQPMAMTRRF